MGITLNNMGNIILWISDDSVVTTPDGTGNRSTDKTCLTALSPSHPALQHADREKERFPKARILFSGCRVVFVRPSPPLQLPPLHQGKSGSRGRKKTMDFFRRVRPQRTNLCPCISADYTDRHTTCSPYPVSRFSGRTEHTGRCESAEAIR